MARANVSRWTRSILCLLVLVLTLNFQLGSSLEIAEPTFTWDGFRLNINYKISGSIAAEKVTYDIVSDKDCEGGVIDAEEIETQLIETSDSSVRISILMNPESIHAARYVTHHDDYAIVGVCSRIWINKPDETFEPISANRDDYILIKADLENLDGVIEILEDKAKNWGVDVYMCNDNYVRIQNPPTIRNGEKLRLCAKPTQRTINEGVTLGTIKSFYFEREGVLQDAVATYGTDDVTNVFKCERGSTLCVIETILKNDFFFSPGEVKAEGVFFMQWGKQVGNRRNLRTIPVKANMRSLYEWYEQGQIVSEKVGKTMIEIEPMDKVYSADAFACDDQNLPSKVSTLNETDHLKICIKPNKEAREAGVYMNSLESFSFALANDDRSQQAIDSYGRVVEPDITKVDCPIGASVCSVNSTLQEWFFDEDATMVATGYAVLQFGSDRRRRAQVSLDGLSFAGRDQIETFFDTIGRNPENEKSPTRQWFDNIFDRYDLNDTHLTILYIVAIVLIVLIVLCCCAGCIFFFWWGRDTRIKEEPQDRTHNIDIKINQHGKEVSEFQDEREESQSNYNGDYYGYGGYPRRNSNGSEYPRRNSNDYPRRNSNSDHAPPMSPRQKRRNSNSERAPPMSPRPRGNSNSEHAPPKSPRPRRMSNSSQPPKSPHRRRNSNSSEVIPRSPRPKNRRNSNSSEDPRSPRSKHSRRNSNGSHQPRRNSNSSEQIPRSPRPKNRRKSGSHSRRNSNE